MKKESVTSVGAAVFLALYGMPHVVFAQQTSAADTSSSTGPVELAEITVTANRREQTLEEVPYSMSVVSAEQLDQAGVTDLSSLANEVPGTEHVRFRCPVGRGHGSGHSRYQCDAEPTRGFRSFEQNPVGTYIGNSPIDGYFQLDDLKQVEVLRGPQGTFYGAGALGGALRLIPNDPDVKRSAALWRPAAADSPTPAAPATP